MSQTIKDKVISQIQIHQHLLDFEDSDSDQIEEQKQLSAQLNNLPRHTINHHLYSDDDSDSEQHQIMNQRRKVVLQNLQYSSKENIPAKNNKQQRPLKPTHSNQLTSSSENKQILCLKSKIAQLLKETQTKTSKITQLQTNLSLMAIKIDHLQQEIAQKSANLTQKQQKITSLTTQNNTISENYEQTLNEYQKQFKKRTESLNYEVTEISQSTAQKDRKIELLFNLVKLKDQEIEKLTQNDQKAQKYIIQNSKLKSDVKRLITLLQSSLKNQTLSKSAKNILEEKLSTFKSKKSRSKSFAVENIFLDSKIKTTKHLSSSFDAHYASLPSKGSKHQRTSSDWVSTDLINEVESFLKKWRMAQNNKNFVNSLVSFIHSYLQKCVAQAKTKMDNKYKSLKKQIQRKANQSLVFGQILKERELKIKLNKSQNKETFTKSPFKGNETKIENLNLTSENVSILVPASNKKFKESRKNNFLCGSLLLDKTQKDDIGYTNLEKSMKIHRENSAHAFDVINPLSQTSKKIANSFILGKKSVLQQKKKHCRTQSSVKSQKKWLINSSNKKKSIKSVSQKKSFDFPLKKFKIL